LSLVDVRSGRVTGECKLPGRVVFRWQAVGEACAVSGDGRWVFSLDNSEEEGTTGRLSIHDLKSGEILATYLDEAPGTPKTDMMDRFYMLRLLPGGRKAIWTTRDGYLHRWQWAEQLHGHWRATDIAGLFGILLVLQTVSDWPPPGMTGRFGSGMRRTWRNCACF